MRKKSDQLCIAHANEGVGMLYKSESTKYNVVKPSAEDLNKSSQYLNSALEYFLAHDQNYHAANVQINMADLEMQLGNKKKACEYVALSQASFEKYDKAKEIKPSYYNPTTLKFKNIDGLIAHYHQLLGCS